jgi:hypothetical protein
MVKAPPPFVKPVLEGWEERDAVVKGDKAGDGKQNGECERVFAIPLLFARSS